MFLHRLKILFQLSNLALLVLFTVINASSQFIGHWYAPLLQISNGQNQFSSNATHLPNPIVPIPSSLYTLHPVQPINVQHHFATCSATCSIIIPKSSTLPSPAFASVVAISFLRFYLWSSHYQTLALHLDLLPLILSPHPLSYVSVYFSTKSFSSISFLTSITS